MTPADAGLLAQAESFAEDIGRLLANTIAPDAVVGARILGDRITVSPVNHEGDKARLELPVNGDPMVWLDVSFRASGMRPGPSWRSTRPHSRLAFFR